MRDAWGAVLGLNRYHGRVVPNEQGFHTICPRLALHETDQFYWLSHRSAHWCQSSRTPKFPPDLRPGDHLDLSINPPTRFSPRCPSVQRQRRGSGSPQTPLGYLRRLRLPRLHRRPGCARRASRGTAPQTTAYSNNARRRLLRPRMWSFAGQTIGYPRMSATI